MKTIKIEIPADELFIHELMQTISNARRRQAKNMFRDADDPSFEDVDTLFDWLNYETYGLLLTELNSSLFELERKKRTTIEESKQATVNIQ